ncbi:hypothetical protein EJ08DRAFT_699831 [Tothia fuscella]|uniref:Uncharacterized protein n=1 Tax=Tothia fuscella TaxID=1048955 RepID=A0A9P4TVW5_9PEZI|nr:hypothetical protein EJ08DRAFT_699831 [Tothia fuscella]
MAQSVILRRIVEQIMKAPRELSSFKLSIATTCATQTVYKTEGDTKPRSIYGCFGAGKLYLTTPVSPSSVAGSAPSSALKSGAAQSSQPTPSGAAASSSTSSSSSATPVAATKSTTHVGIIAAGAGVGIALLLAIAGLIAWILILKKRNASRKPPSNTELQQMNADGKGSVPPPKDFKAELPTNEGWAAELPPESAPGSRQEQKPWSNLSAMPQSPAPSYSPAPPYPGVVSPMMPVGGGSGPAPDPFYGVYGGPNTGGGVQHAGMAELPGGRTQQHPLPGSARPQYAELG